MSIVFGSINIDFETMDGITEEQFELFKKKIYKVVDELENDFFDAAEECGFEIESVHPVMIDLDNMVLNQR